MDHLSFEGERVWGRSVILKKKFACVLIPRTSMYTITVKKVSLAFSESNKMHVTRRKISSKHFSREKLFLVHERVQYPITPPPSKSNGLPLNKEFRLCNLFYKWKTVVDTEPSLHK